jgi:hypothetical protein
MSQPLTHLRPATLADLAQISALDQAIFGEYQRGITLTILHLFLTEVADAG